MKGSGSVVQPVTAAGPGEGRRRLVVDVDAVAVQRLEQLGAATGTGAGAEVMAVVVLEHYARTLSPRYCFEHDGEGCGCAGQGGDTTSQGT